MDKRPTSGRCAALGLLALLQIGLPFSGQAAIAVIVHPSFPLDRLSPVAVKRLFLNKINKLPGGYSLRPVNQAAESKVRAEFEAKVLGKNKHQMRSYWARQIFSGKARPPGSTGNDGDVMRLISNNPQAIGYIDKASLSDKVKAVLLVP